MLGNLSALRSPVTLYVRILSKSICENAELPSLAFSIAISGRCVTAFILPEPVPTPSLLTNVGASLLLSSL